MSTHASQPPSSPGFEASQEERRFRALIENAYDVIVLNDTQGNIVYASPSIKRVLGYTPEEFTRLRASQVIHPDDHPAVAQLFTALLQQEQGIVAAQYRVRHKNGTWRWVEGTWENLLSNPQIEAVVLNVHDITARKQAEETLQWQAELFANISDAVFSTDLDNIITSWNTAAERLYGWREQEVLGKNAFEINPPLLAQGKLETIIRDLFEKGEWRGEVVQQRKNSSYLHVSASTSLIKDTKGRVIGYVTVNRDITEQQHSRQWNRLLNRASNVLASSLDHQIKLQEIAELIVSSIADYCRIVIVDESLRIKEIQVNHSDPQKIALVQELYMQYKDKASSTHGLQRILEGGQPELITEVSQETLIPVQDNPELLRIVDALDLKSYMGVPLIARDRLIGAATFSSAQPYRSYTQDDLVFAQELARRIALALDNARLYHEAQKEIAERKLAEEKLRENEQRKDEFISMASHELKTPITSLKGFLAILQKRLSDQGQADERSLHYLTRMDVQLDRLTKLVAELLDITRMQTGKLDYREEVFDLAALAQEMVEIAQETTRTHHLQFEGNAPVFVFADRDRIGQVMINLLSNAIKYSPRADTALIHVSTDQHNARLSIQDFGIGIDEEYYQKIFERFYQVAEPIEKTFPGLGIGLYISYEIIKRHGGNIWVRSAKGEGSTFYVTLPLWRGDK